ncbi:MBL fold metallo-hydrolase [Bacillus thuringiensis]|uniref:MBL fold metallo-hydrolase n=1 Tax=Bacillus thuringiensis TaxID=1428 RepID=UPI000A3C0D5C|nr:MBL fold metallo-hydrolase [Bacillus thuringiensis]MED3348547.1 MBL fold metallo-hydrolase [Bacillus thuringiensis]MRB07814.1 MBL fold metallo-hydrolase [Bacillus thuringiensis]OTW90323.1 MBL fold metallo-hydrolase [Bacillus thuringiensis serovar sumiyoshiensis]OTW96899.1 MBL fold metallo-hydrolase [Bacillus thuringiensis serovar fukuokaensis]PEB13580.1 MBL fold metallo-hydrolase [Bacillus thuringiensis]
MKKVEQLSSHLYLIDDFDLQHNERTGTYVLLGDDITLIETCAAPSLPYILDGLQQLHIDLNDVKNIIVTHVHLDHAGAAGLMMEKCPNATLYVHSRGARHMIDPTKLILGAKAVYKEDFDKLFDPILPIEEERVHIVQHGDTLKIAKDRTLTFYDTPGHAKHHISIHDSLTNGIFTGDTIGIYYRELADVYVELYLPSTSPSQFQPDAMIASKNHIQSMNVDTIYFGHYGASSHVTEVYNQLEHWLPIFVQTGKEVFEKYNDFDEATKALQTLLMDKISSHLTKLNVPSDHSVYNILHLDIEISAMGIIDYFTKQEKANSTIN